MATKKKIPLACGIRIPMSICAIHGQPTAVVKRRCTEDGLTAAAEDYNSAAVERKDILLYLKCINLIEQIIFRRPVVAEPPGRRQTCCHQTSVEPLDPPPKVEMSDAPEEEKKCKDII
ncbi:uncharacterized protein LOC107885863 [Acyrthosiphon pisum]|uniref:Uncharacterized protein n=1 Tax=Acyrthosiphon pisum TaxID=7029 RepID=A0A8R2NTY9_ACYPI|nr:uncharacterized protein LOC107885863 [Acyrthosiphon pisum]